VEYFEGIEYHVSTPVVPFGTIQRYAWPGVRGGACVCPDHPNGNARVGASGAAVFSLHGPFQACVDPSDVHALPTCSYLDDNSLSGTLPKEWSTLKALNTL
jgi:hypothetical protein